MEKFLFVLCEDFRYFFILSLIDHEIKFIKSFVRSVNDVLVES